MVTAKSKSKNKKTSLKFNKKLAKVFIGVFIVAICALAIVCVAYSFSYKSKVLPRTYFSNSQNLEGKNIDELKDYLNQTAQRAKDEKIKAVKDDKTWEMSLDDFGWKIDIDKTANRIFSYGHSGGFFTRVSDLLRSIALKKYFEPAVEFNTQAAEDWFNKINDEIGTPKQEANIAVKDGKARVVEPSTGKSIDELPAQKSLMDRFLLKNLQPIQIRIIDDAPTITKAEADLLQDRAINLSSEDVKLTGPNGTVTLSSDTIGSMIELKKKMQKSFLSQARPTGPAYVSFNSDKVKSFLQDNADTLNDNPVDAKFTITDGKVSIYQPSKDGKTIQLDESASLIISDLEKGGFTKIELPSQEQKANISAQTASDISQFGITQLIGTATTSFTKSPQNRIANIKTGVAAISGSLIKTGDEFSTLARLGNIDATSGYLPELVIKENATVPEFGGGLCQVSTTLFRATMNAGLKITARQNHSYRVSYYEPPVGMDATIYSPSPDFKFTNDTPAYILIEGHVDGIKVTFDFYGTKDDRTVNITDPVVYDITSPPPDIYTDDPSLAPGEVKQIDHAHAGAKATFNYTVTRDGKVINKQTFNSVYTPWPAKFLKGPDAPATDSPQPSN